MLVWLCVMFGWRVCAGSVCVCTWVGFIRTCLFCFLIVLSGVFFFFFLLRIRRPPRSPQGSSSAASAVYKRQVVSFQCLITRGNTWPHCVTYSTKCKRPTPPVRAECSLFRCCVSPLPTAFVALRQAVPRCLAWGGPASLLRHSRPPGYSRIGMCSSVDYGLIVDIHEVLTCCRFSLHSILLREHSFN